MEGAGGKEHYLAVEGTYLIIRITFRHCYIAMSVFIKKIPHTLAYISI